MWKKTTNFKTHVNILPRDLQEIVVFIFLSFMSLSVHKYIITSKAASIPPTPPNTIRRCLNSGSVQSSTSVPFKKELLS